MFSLTFLVWTGVSFRAGQGVIELEGILKEWEGVTTTTFVQNERQMTQIKLAASKASSSTFSWQVYISAE